MGGIILAGLGASIVLFRKGGAYNPIIDPEIDLTPSTMPPEPQIATVQPVLQWTTPSLAYHAVRVTCDNLGLTLEQKNLICACIYQESRFNNNAVNKNVNTQGVVTSRDWGLAQVNDYFHCGVGKDFPSASYVVANPDKAVEWMIKLYKEGLLKLWVSYSSGAYKQWLSPTSPMWHLAT